jgi:hypothetical protein
MKVAIVSESPADQAAISQLASAAVGVAFEAVPVAIRHGGWTTVLQTLGSIIPAVYYQTDAEGLVIVVDSDDSPLHDNQHDPTDPANAKCRICGIGQALTKAISRLRARPMPQELKFAVGLAVPSMEAWLLCGDDHSVCEAAWANARRQNTIPYTRLNLKHRLYGTERPSLEQQTATMRQHSERIVNSGQLQLLEQLFPLGFGMLAQQLREWISPMPSR